MQHCVLLHTPALFGANQCVNPSGNACCKSSINAAIAAAGANDTVKRDQHRWP